MWTRSRVEKRARAETVVIPARRVDLSPQRRANLREVMIAVAHRVILEHELARDRRVAVERDRRGAIELLVAQRADRGRGRRAVLPQQIDALRVLRRRIVLGRVGGVHRVHVVHVTPAPACRATTICASVNLERVHAGDVVHDDADLAAVMGDARLPLRVGEAGREGRQRLRALLEPVGQGLRARARHCVPRPRAPRLSLPHSTSTYPFQSPPCDDRPAVSSPYPEAAAGNHAHTSDCLADRPEVHASGLRERPSSSTDPPVKTADVLSDVLRAVRLTGAVYFDFELSSPWVAEAPPSREIASLVMPGAERVIEYHLMASRLVLGARVGENRRSVLPKATSSSFRRATRTCSRARPGMRERPDRSRCSRPSTPLPIVYELGGGGADRARHRLLLSRLRRTAVQSAARRAAARHSSAARTDRRPTRLLATLLSWRSSNRARRAPGGENVLARLSELMFVEAIRRYLETLPAAEAGWLAGLRDPVVGQALAALHGDAA